MSIQLCSGEILNKQSDVKRETLNLNFQIHDGQSESAFRLGRFCGKTLPFNGSLITSDNSLFLMLVSLDRSARKSFKLKWETIDPSKFLVYNFT